ncbi:recombinase family protein [Streptococcus periodonticum]|uniref:Recombinase family protein n=1 Tax=Streptococcus periodonticum TaxID=2490633 RepID=A0A3Q9F3N1_9STRE|nr:recombinase family protein [Streptococcus periodonticum]AZQ41957.1 recombinase family protein [Streptococcus periodonticum]
MKAEKKRVCAYTRVSTMTEKQQDSLTNQQSYYNHFYQNKKDVDFIGVYYDQGISGKLAKRPGFQQMLEDCRAGKIDVIHTKSISRFARNTELLLTVSRELKTIQVDIFFEEQNLHTLSNEGEVMLTVLASYAEEELRNMSENQRWAFQNKFQRGELVINTKRFLGYDKDENGELIINPEEAKIVKRIYNLYLSGMGVHVIAKLFNEEKVSTVDGGKWYSSTITNILKNEKYKGDAILQKYYFAEIKAKQRLNQGQVQQYLITDNHEAIVSREDWEAVQKRLKQNRKANLSIDYNRRYPLSGLLKCEHCGSTLKRQKYYKGKVVWVCSKYIREGKEACIGMRVPDSVVQDWRVTKPTIVKEEIINGKKHYCYSSKENDSSGNREACPENPNGGLLSGVYRPRRTAIKL